MKEPAGRDTGRRPTDWKAVTTGAVTGVVIVAAVVVVQLVLRATSDDELSGGWRLVLFFGILTAFFLSGERAARRCAGPPVTHAIKAALLALAAWIPLRLAVALAYDDRDPLAGVVLGAAFAIVVGAVGGMFGAWRREGATT